MTTLVVATRPSGQLSLMDRLSRLTFLDACKILGPNGSKLIQKHANNWDIDIENDVLLREDQFSVRVPVTDGPAPTVTIKLADDVKKRLHWNCDRCYEACAHVGAVFSLILEEKTALGLAIPPAPRVAIESLDEDELVTRALAERAERARIEKMAVRTADP